MTDAVPTVAYLGLDHHHCGPYLETLQQLPVSVACAFEPDASIDPADVEALPDVPLYRALDDLLAAERPDVAWVTLPNRDTPGVLKRVLGAGLDAYVEKPVGRTADDVEPLVMLAEETGATVATSYPWRRHPIAVDLQRWAADGYYGDVKSISLRFFASAMRHRDPDHYLYDAAASRGGIVQWLGVHWIDLVPWILDDPIVAVNARLSGDEKVDVETDAVVDFETASGAVGSLDCGYALGPDRYDTRVDIRGSSARSAWDPMGRTFGFDGETTLELKRDDRAWAAAPRRTVTYSYEPAPGYGGSWGRAFMESFFAARRGDGAIPADLSDAVAVLRVLDAIYRAAESGSWVSVDR